MLRTRVRVEEQALESAGGYAQHLGGRRRLLPGLGGGS